MRPISPTRVKCEINRCRSPFGPTVEAVTLREAISNPRDPPAASAPYSLSISDLSAASSSVSPSAVSWRPHRERSTSGAPLTCTCLTVMGHELVSGIEGNFRRLLRVDLAQ